MLVSQVIQVRSYSQVIQVRSYSHVIWRADIGGGDEVIADFKDDECSHSPLLAGHL